MSDDLNESWQRYPEARIRMREGGLDELLASLGKNGMFISGEPRVRLLDDGIYIEFLTNVKAKNRIAALPIDIFIPCKVPDEQTETSPEAEVQEEQPQEEPAKEEDERQD